MKNKQPLNGDVFLVKWRSLADLSFTEKWLRFLQENVLSHKEMCELTSAMFMAKQTYYKWFYEEKRHLLPPWPLFFMTMLYLGVPLEVIETELREEYAAVVARQGRRTTEHQRALLTAQTDRITDPLKAPKPLNEMNY